MAFDAGESEVYRLTDGDSAIVVASRELLSKVAQCPLVRPAEIVSVAKLLHVFSRVPKITAGVSVTVCVTGRRNKFGDIETQHWWAIAADDDQLSVSSGGLFYRPTTGGDTFSTLSWLAMPDEPCELLDYLQTLSVVPDVLSFPDAVRNLDLTSGVEKIRIADSDNPFLEAPLDEETEHDSGEGDDDDEDEIGIPWTVLPGDEADQQLAAWIDGDEVARNPAQYANGAESCGCCGCGLETRSLFVDGCLRSQQVWGNMCAACFFKKGTSIGRGQGHLFARQPNGEWRLVAGFTTD